MKTNLLLFSGLFNKRQFFVDFTAGNDANSGRSTASPWKTVAKINAYTDFISNDRVRFKRAETWDLSGGGLIVPRHSLRFGAYGSGALPILDGGRAINNVFDTAGKDGSYIESVHVKSGIAFGFEIDNSHNGVLTGVEASDCGNDNILFTNNSFDWTVGNISSHDNYDGGSGAGLSLFEIKDGCHDIAADSLTLDGSVDLGLTIHSHNPLQGDCMPYNITIRNVAITDCVDTALRVAKQDTQADATSRNILLENFTIGGTAGVGLSVVETALAQVLSGVTFKNGVVNLLGAINQFPMTCLGTATYQNMVFAGTYPNQVDTKGNAEFYNCVFYRPSSGTLQIKNSPVRTKLRNCIIYSVGIICIDFQSITGIEDVDYNLYWSEALANSWKWNGVAGNWATWQGLGNDLNSPTPANPNFVNPVSDWHLQAGSPAIDAGVDVGLAYLGDAPDCGAYEKA